MLQQLEATSAHLRTCSAPLPLVIRALICLRRLPRRPGLTGKCSLQQTFDQRLVIWPARFVLHLALATIGQKKREDPMSMRHHDACISQLQGAEHIKARQMLDKCGILPVRVCKTTCKMLVMPVQRYVGEPAQCQAQSTSTSASTSALSIPTHRFEASRLDPFPFQSFIIFSHIASNVVYNLRACQTLSMFHGSIIRHSLAKASSKQQLAMFRLGLALSRRARKLSSNFRTRPHERMFKRFFPEHFRRMVR